MNLRALIFDVDGTMADTEETHRQAFNAAFLTHELWWDWSRHQYVDLLRTSGGKERIAAYIDTLRLPDEEKARLTRLVPLIHDTKTRIYGELIVDGRAPLRPGVARLIREARTAGVRLAIASTTTSANAEALIRAQLGSDARGWFEVIACGDLVARKKPAPDIYLRALGMLRLPSAACIAFEDSFNGLAAAKAAGLYTVVTPNYWSAAQDFSGADLVLHNLGEPATPLDAGSMQRLGAPFLDLARLNELHAASPRGTAA